MAKTRRPARKPVPRATTPARALDLLRASARQAVNVTTRTVLARANEARALVAGRTGALRESLAERAAEARTRTTKTVSKLERAFEQRVSQAVAKLGIPSNREVRSLARQVAELQANVNQLRRARSRARAS